MTISATGAKVLDGRESCCVLTAWEKKKSRLISQLFDFKLI